MACALSAFLLIVSCFFFWNARLLQMSISQKYIRCITLPVKDIYSQIQACCCGGHLGILGQEIQFCRIGMFTEIFIHSFLSESRLINLQLWWIWSLCVDVWGGNTAWMECQSITVHHKTLIFGKRAGVIRATLWLSWLEPWPLLRAPHINAHAFLDSTLPCASTQP